MPGSAILGVEPWNSFTPPPEVLKDYKEIVEFLNGSGATGNGDSAEKSDANFRSQLLRDLQQSGIEEALGYKPKDEDAEFNGFFSWIGIGVSLSDFEYRIREVEDRLKEHFGIERKGAAAKVGLTRSLEKTILDSGRDLAEDLYNRVTEKAQESEGKDKEWTQNNNNAVECLAQILGSSGISVGHFRPPEL